MFVDKATITVKGGDGGNGCCSFRREKFVPRGGPDGGDGGGGGHVIMEATTGQQSLVDLIYNRHYAAPRGPGGKGKNLHGRKADDIVLKVPVGTVVKDAVTGELVVDLATDGERFIVAHGGRGGRGNARFLSNFNRAPREHEPGEPDDAVPPHVGQLQVEAGVEHAPCAGERHERHGERHVARVLATRD